MRPIVQTAFDQLVDEDVRERVHLMFPHANALGYDPWGGSLLATQRTLAVVKWLYRHYFRVETEGTAHVPEGRCMLVGHHSAQLAYDGVLVSAAVALDRDPPRHVHAMIEQFFGRLPFVNVLMQRLGQQIGVPAICDRLLEADEAVLVFPEGHRGGGRVFKDRYEVLGFSQGFMRMALRARAPIVPFGFVGGEEMCMSFSRMEPLARLMGAPYWPLTPTVVPVPLPAKCHLTFGEPLFFEGRGDEPDGIIQPMIERVEREVKRLIDHGLAKRRGLFFG